MRVSDWRSDVCSAYLPRHLLPQAGEWLLPTDQAASATASPIAACATASASLRCCGDRFRPSARTNSRSRTPMNPKMNFRYGSWKSDRKSVVVGKSVSVRVDLGGRRIIKKKNSNSTDNDKSQSKPKK